MSQRTLSAACDGARPRLASLGDLGTALVITLGVIERAGAGRGIEALSDPTFALDVLEVAPGVNEGQVGRVLDFLRSSEGHGPIDLSHVPRPEQPMVTIADAVAGYEIGPLALKAPGTVSTYRTWTRRLVAAHGPQAPRDVTAGDLRDLIAKHVLAGHRSGERRRSGRSAEENAIGAFRHLWGYFAEKGWVAANEAMRLAKQPRPEPNRRPIRPDEAVLLRHLAAATGRDPLLDEVSLSLAERLGLRRIELCRARLCDVDVGKGELKVWGKDDKRRTMPLPPVLSGLLVRYLDDRRPVGVSMGAWLTSEESLLRRRPTATYPAGRTVGRRRIEDLFDRLHAAAPQVFADGDLSLHSYRHALGTFVDTNYGRAVSRAVLGHTSRRSVTDCYVHVSMDQMAEALTAYEAHVVEPDAGR